MKKILFFIHVLLIFLLTSVTYAQFQNTTIPKLHAEFRPVLGGWSEYQITSKEGASYKMKVAIVGREGNAYWYETLMESKAHDKIITKMLISGNPEDRNNIKRMIVKMGNQPPMEIPLQMVQPNRDQDRSTKPIGKAVDKGTETIKVPAGTFKARHIQYQDTSGVVDTWIHNDLTPYNLIKSQSKDMEMILIAYGTDAKTSITETPRKFEMPKVPQAR